MTHSRSWDMEIMTTLGWKCHTGVVIFPCPTHCRASSVKWWTSRDGVSTNQRSGSQLVIRQYQLAKTTADRRNVGRQCLLVCPGFGPVERKPVRTKAQQNESRYNEIPSERQPVRKKAQQNEKPNLNRFTINFVLEQSLLRLVTLPLRHNTNGKKNSQISVASYGNNFTGAGTGYRLKLLVCL